MHTTTYTHTPAAAPRLRGMAAAIGRFLRAYSEFWSIPMALVLFVGTPPLLRLYDPTAAGYDPGVLQSVTFALAALLLAKGSVWMMLALDFPDVYHYLDHSINAHFRRIGECGSREPDYRKPIALGLYALYLICLVTLIAAMV